MWPYLFLAIVSVTTFWGDKHLSFDFQETESRISYVSNDYDNDIAIIKSDFTFLHQHFLISYSLKESLTIPKEKKTLLTYNWFPEHRITQPQSILTCGCHSPPSKRDIKGTQS